MGGSKTWFGIKLSLKGGSDLKDMDAKDGFPVVSERTEVKTPVSLVTEDFGRRASDHLPETAAAKVALTEEDSTILSDKIAEALGEGEAADNARALAAEDPSGTFEKIQIVKDAISDPDVAAELLSELEL